MADYRHLLGRQWAVGLWAGALDSACEHQFRTNELNGQTASAGAVGRLDHPDLRG